MMISVTSPLQAPLLSMNRQKRIPVPTSMSYLGSYFGETYKKPLNIRALELLAVLLESPSETATGLVTAGYAVFKKGVDKKLYDMLLTDPNTRMPRFDSTMCVQKWYHPLTEFVNDHTGLALLAPFLLFFGAKHGIRGLSRLVRSPVVQRQLQRIKPS